MSFLTFRIYAPTLRPFLLSDLIGSAYKRKSRITRRAKKDRAKIKAARKQRGATRAK